MIDSSSAPETLLQACCMICGHERSNHVRLLMVEAITGIRSGSLAAETTDDGYMVDPVTLAQWFTAQPTRPAGLAADVESMCLDFVDRHDRRTKRHKPNKKPGPPPNPLKAIARAEWLTNQTLTAEELFSVLCNRPDTVIDDDDDIPVKVGVKGCNDRQMVSVRTISRWLKAFRNH
jgi:hypothetical protein